MTTTPARILCPVDFSDSSAQALAHAAAVARWYGAELTALHVHQVMVPVIGVGPYVDASLPVVLSDAERAQVETALATFAAAETSGATLTTALVEDLNVPAAILARIEQMRADLVVIGTQGRSGFERVMLGSVAERVLRKAACPVLTVPPHAAREALTAPGAIREVLCAIDFSSSSASALCEASSWAAKAGARLTVIHVAEMLPEGPQPPSAQYVAYRQVLVDDARQAMLQAIPDAIRHNSRFDERIVVGRPAAVILQLAEQRQAGLIVMGVRGRTAVDLAVFGSTTQQVVRRAPCPVLAVHPAPADALGSGRS
jgi:nucleotide-binding universal stress UspA family protein